jgi:NADPH:quinone reductase-like Zn-dependent oxidoreductase
VLVNGAAGGVGLFAVQLAHSYGAAVTGICGTRNIELLRSVGATEVVDYTDRDFTRTGPYDVLIDLVGNRSLRDLRRAVTPGGTLVLSGGGVFRGGSLIGPMGLVIRGALAARFVRQRIEVPNATPNPANLATIRDLAASGVLIPVIDRTFPLDEAAAAIS